MVRPQGFLERHDNQRKLGDVIKRDVWVSALAVHLLKVTGMADLDMIHCTKLMNRFCLGGMTLGLVHIMEVMGDRSWTANSSVQQITNMSAELIGTEKEVSALVSNRIRVRERAMATVGDRVTRGTGLAREEGMAGSDGTNVVKNHIDRVLQVLKVAKIGLTGEEGGLGTDVLEMVTRLGGLAVGLEVSTMQVPRMRVGINREP